MWSRGRPGKQTLRPPKLFMFAVHYAVYSLTLKLHNLDDSDDGIGFFY